MNPLAAPPSLPPFPSLSLPPAAAAAAALHNSNTACQSISSLFRRRRRDETKVSLLLTLSLSPSLPLSQQLTLQHSCENEERVS